VNWRVFWHLNNAARIVAAALWQQRCISHGASARAAACLRSPIKAAQIHQPNALADDGMALYGGKRGV